MKATTFLVSFLVIFSIFVNSVSCSTAQALEPVLDTQGNPLSPTSSYYMMPVITGPKGGGVIRARTGNKTCPLDVVQLWFDRGQSLTFTLVNPNEEVIRVSTDLNIAFTWGVYICKSTVWMVDKYDESTGQYFITSINNRTDGVKGNPGPKTITNWFTIEKGPLGYKLVYCPKVCPFCQPICKDVGVFIQDIYRRLSLSDSTLQVVFLKAS